MMKLLRGYIWLAIAFFGWACTGQMNPTQAQVQAQRDELSSGAAVDASPNYVAAVGRFKSALAALSAQPNNAALVQPYLETAFAVSRLHCDDHLNALQSKANGLGWARGQTDLAGGFTSAIMGITGAAATAISGAGVGFALLAGSLDNYEQSFIPSPDVAALQKMIGKAQAAFEATTQQSPPTSYAQAESFALAFDQICTFKGMTALVNEAVSKAQPVATSEPHPMMPRSATGAPIVSPGAWAYHGSTPVLGIRDP